MSFGFANQVADGAITEHNFGRRYAAAGNTGQKPLGNYSRKSIGKLKPNLILLFPGKNVNNPVNGLTGVIGTFIVTRLIDLIDFPLNYAIMFLVLSLGGFLSFYFSSRITLPDQVPPPITNS